METFWTTDGTVLYQGACRAGDRQATQTEVSVWLASFITLEAVKAECARRIAVVVTDNQKLDMLASMIADLQTVAILQFSAVSAGPTDAQKADAASFQSSMQWIVAMKAACAGLVGNVNYQQDGNWPVLPDGLAAFAARF